MMRAAFTSTTSWYLDLSNLHARFYAPKTELSSKKRRAKLPTLPAIQDLREIRIGVANLQLAVLAAEKNGAVRIAANGQRRISDTRCIYGRNRNGLTRAARTPACAAT